MVRGALGRDVEPPDRMIFPSRRSLMWIYDLIGAPLRMVVLPDVAAEGLGLTSLRAERMRAVLPKLRGRVLDIGAGDNLLIRLYRRHAGRLGQDSTSAQASLGVDVHDWGEGCALIRSSAALPFPASSFDTVCFIACLNHIPERQQALVEARRVLRPDGRVIATMINRVVGGVGHALWWYSEEKHRPVDPDETSGLAIKEILALFDGAGFRLISRRRFGYGLNAVYVATPVL